MFWRKKAIRSEKPSTSSKDYRAIALTDLGSVRDHNEDQILFVRPTDSNQRNRKGFVAMVADGMGGHAAGEIASALAIKIISQTYFNHPENNPLTALKQSMLEANNLIFNEGKNQI
ncbi:MAG: hypothetical protein IPL46_28065 [Saprospiraceae bacterium]|nr:hypothetical protein [Saprospiraceae bacterium]